MLVCGGIQTATAGYAFVIRLNSDGSYDSGFANGAGYALYTSNAVSTPYFLPTTVALLSNGKILVGGLGNHGSDPSNADMTVLRLGADGSVDTTFGTNGWTYVAFDLGQSLSDYVQSMSIDSSGRIVLAGVVEGPTTNLWGVARLLANGQIDTTFATQGRTTFSFASDGDGSSYDTPNSVVALPDGRILVGGSVAIGSFGTNTNYGGYFQAALMLQSNGTPDPAFGTGGTFIGGDDSMPYSTAIIHPIGVFVNGDNIYFPGYGFKADGSDVDFGINKVTRSIFRDGFENP